MVALQWQMAKQWLVSAGSTRRDMQDSVDLLDFAQSLRDGEILCEVANRLKSGSVRDVSTVSNINMHMFLCLRNIRAFLRACAETFNIASKDLFSANDLYDVSNFQMVIHTLSLLSKTLEARNSGLIPFPPENHRDQEEDIYDRLPDIILEKQQAKITNDHSYYDFSTEENIYDTVTVDEKIYDDIVQCTNRKSSSLKKHVDKRTHVINEIIETEENYVKALRVMIEDMIKPLKGHMTKEDREKIFLNTEALYLFHYQFQKDLTARKPETQKLNIRAFLLNKEKFLIYGSYCYGLPDAQKHVLELCKDHGFLAQVEACNQKAGRSKFPLQEQLVVPFQRILKYPLLLKSLLNQTPDGHEDKSAIEKSLEAMDDVGKYINEYCRDRDMVKTITRIEDSVKYDLGVQQNKTFQYGRYISDGELQVKFDSNERKYKRTAFLFEKNLLLCKSKGDSYDVKEVFDFTKFKVGDIPSLGKGKFCQGWAMQALTHDGASEAKNCIMLTKTTSEKITWVSAIQRCTELVTLSKFQHKLDEHKFELLTFEKPTNCSACSRLLLGQISQGYKCTNCGIVLHYNCFEDCPKCSPAPQAPDRLSRPLHPTPTNLKGVSYERAALRPGPPPPVSPVSPTSLKTPAPSAMAPEPETLDHSPWFAGSMSRQDAEQQLQGQEDGAFLVRASSNNPGLAISIAYQGDVKHIKIVQQGNRFYLTDPKQFASIADLVTFYKENSLGQSFPALPTVLTKGVAPKSSRRTMRAKFRWQARNARELSFEAGHVIKIISDDGNWWLGECNGQEGYFPRNHVE